MRKILKVFMLGRYLRKIVKYKTIAKDIFLLTNFNTRTYGMWTVK